jgi:ATP-dependent DNA ligase
LRETEIREKPAKRKAGDVAKILCRWDGREMFQPVCKLGLEGIVSKKLNAPHKSGPSKAWLKIKNPKAPAATRAIDGTF